MTGSGDRSEDDDRTIEWPSHAETGVSADDGRDAVERLAEDFAERCRRGESPSIAEYERRHPAHAEALRRLLPMVAALEGAKRGGSGLSEADEPPAAPPEQLGDFRIVRELGRGGMGVVYEAEQEALGRFVALKVIYGVQLDPRRLRRFRREAEAVARLHHTNIVPIFGVGEQDGLPYFAMQLIRGRGLDAVLKQWRWDGPPPGDRHWRFVARVGRQAAEALQYAHDQGILHRDIKPANLLLDGLETTWITDFGLAKLAGSDDLTATGDVVGTLRYLAPEALRGQSGPASDVYGLGLTLYELLTLSAPFGDLSASELLRHVSEAQLARPRSVDPEIPRDLETIVLKATAKEPGHRYATAGALADDLRRYLEDRPILARRASTIERARRWARRNRLAAFLMATAAAALLLAAIVGWVGYLSTSRALQRARTNEQLSLAIFDGLFERLGVETNFLPPPPGRSARHRMPPPGSGTSDRERLSGLPGPPPGGPGQGPPKPPPDGGPGGPGGPGGRGPREDPTLLREVLEFYDRFARQNAANPRLQLEAAWAHRRVGAIHESMGRHDEATRANARAVAMLEDLVARQPEVPEIRAKLVETYIMANPWTAPPKELPAMTGRLRRAESHVERLAADAPDEIDWLTPMLHVQAKLGTALRRLGDLDGAEARYRRAVELGGTLLDRDPDDLRARMDRSDSREAWALLELDRGAPGRARALLHAAAADLEAIDADGPTPSLADRYADLADDYRTLGDEGRAAELALRAERLEPVRSPRRAPGPGPAPSRDDR